MACPPIPHHRIYHDKIEYSAQGRSGSEYIMLYKGDIKYVQNHQDTITKPLRKKHAKKLFQLFKSIQVDSLKYLKVPSKKHQFDGALAARLSVGYGDTFINTSPTFDDNNPPEELKELLDYIKSLVKK